MIEVRFVSDTVLDGVRYRAGSTVVLDDARANECINAGWAADAVTGRMVEPQTGHITLDVHDTEMGMSYE